METQNELEIGIGDKEATSLKPAKVHIQKAEIEEVGDKKNKKVVFSCKHPEKEELIKISQMAYTKGKVITNTGTWLNQDEDENIRKGSALALFMEKFGAKTVNGLVGEEVDTELDERGYLCFKVY